MSYTIVEYLGGDEGHRCGYCKNEKSNFSHGKWMIENVVLLYANNLASPVSLVKHRFYWAS